MQLEQTKRHLHEANLDRESLYEQTKKVGFGYAHNQTLLYMKCDIDGFIHALPIIPSPSYMFIHAADREV